MHEPPLERIHEQVPPVTRLHLFDQQLILGGNARPLPLHLEQRPYVQVFTQSTAETQGSKTPPPNLLVPLRNGRTFALKFAPQALFQAGTD